VSENEARGRRRVISGLIKPMSEEYEPYLCDESRVLGNAESISFPRTEVELRYALSVEYARGDRVTVQGGRTGISAGAVPNGGHIINLSRMDKIMGMRKDDDGGFCVRVQPGVVLTRFSRAVAEKNFDASEWGYAALSALEDFRGAGPYMFAPDPTENTATIGGMAACNASGALTYRYGSTRSHISALRVMLPGGRSVSMRRGKCFAKGRRLQLRADDGAVIYLDLPTYTMPDVKNAAGYFVRDGMDAIDLFIGSDGALGVIFEIEVRLMKRPAHIWSAMCFFGGENDALRFVAECREMLENLAAIEYFDGASLDILRDEKTFGASVRIPDIPARYGAAVCVELHGALESEAMEQLFYVGECIDRAGGDIYDTWLARTPSANTDLREMRRAIPECVNRIIARRKSGEPAINKLASDMAVPDGFLRATLGMYRSGMAEAGLESAVWGHIGNNHLHVNILPRSKDEFEKGKELIAEWAKKVTESGGTISAEHGVGKLKRDALRIMYGDKHILEMSALKRALDPKWLLGCGNILPAPSVI
jgi:D-lactate dehydrogenase (cytochrome)